MDSQTTTDQSKKPRTRTMTPEMLEKLRLAREKAARLQRERKEAHEKALQEPPPPPPPSTPIQQETPPLSLPTPPTRDKKAKKMAKVAQKIQRIVEQESTDNSSDDESDTDDIVTDYLRKRYKHKYKHKYEAKVNHALLKGQAGQMIKQRVSDDVIKLATQSILGHIY